MDGRAAELGHNLSAPSPTPPYDDDTVYRVGVEFFCFHGSTREPRDDLAVANEIFAQCNIHFVSRPPLRLDRTESDKLIGLTPPQEYDPLAGPNDPRPHLPVLEESGSTSVPSVEERIMVTGIRNHHHADYWNRVSIYYVFTMRSGQTQQFGKSYRREIPGYRSLYPGVVIPNHALRSTLAHELGHILGETHFTADQNNLMAENRTGTDLEPEQRNDMRRRAYEGLFP